MHIRAYNESWKSKWDEYVHNSEHSTFFHLIGWETVLKKTFGYKSHYLLAEHKNKICGILPLFLMRNLFFNKVLASFPFAVYAGACADDKKITGMLIERAKDIAQKENVAYLELRNIAPIHDKLHTKELYVTFIKKLPQDTKECLNYLPRKARAAARKGINFGLKAEVGIHLLTNFYQIYTISVRNLGSPVFPFNFLQNIVNEFKDYTTVLGVKHKNKIVAGAFTFLFKDTVLPYYGASLPEYIKYQVNNFMYLKLMEYGIEKGYRYFDFGRSKKGTGSYKFKIYQGFEPQQIYYQYYLTTAKDIPNVSPANPKFRMLINTWKKLPLCITNRIGAKLIKYTPP